MLKRILKHIYRFGTNRWVNIISGLFLYVCGAWNLDQLGNDFHIQSFVVAVLLFIGFSCFDYGLSQFFIKKSSDDPSEAPHEDNAA